MNLKDINLDQIPSQHLATLVSCAADEVLVQNVEGDLANVIKSAKSCDLWFYHTTLDVSQTKLVVEALKDRIEVLYIGPGVSLDFDTLQQYDGSGKCREIVAHYTPSVPHKSILVNYGKVLGWKTEEMDGEDDEDYWLCIKRH